MTMSPQHNGKMLGVNLYGRQLTKEEINNKIHRNFVGGMWDELGSLQCDFLKSQGLMPFHKLLDVGCGCLRGGVHYIRYLKKSHYFGLDINDSLIQAGLIELEEAKLMKKRPTLLVDDQFRLDRFGEKFDFMVSISLFTHLPMNIIVRCLTQARKQLKPGGIYFSTFFQAPKSAYLDKIQHFPGGACYKL